MPDWVLHVDLDQFLAAVEVLRHPELAGRPVVVGGRGDPTERAVVSTASYEARAFGIRSGMPLKTAVRRCPEAILLPVDRPVYEAASEQVMATLRAQPGAVVQVLGWDEAFVGVNTDDPEAYAHQVRAAVLAATRLSCSVGIGDTLVRAKIATEFGKPGGFPERQRREALGGVGVVPHTGGVYALTRDNWFPVMGEQPTSALWGIGKRIAARLAELGLRTVADLAYADEEQLVTAFGPTTGPYLRALGRGISSATVDDTPWVARAHGHETTYQTDLVEPAEIRAAVRNLAEQVVADLHREQRPCAHVHLKVRFAPFFTFTRIRKLAEPTYDVEVVTATALALLAGLDDGRPIRLLGVRGEMVPPEGGY